MKTFKQIVMAVLALSLAVGIAYGGWLVKREVNYSMDYRDKVVETIKEQNAPLVKRIKELEAEVKNLKK